MLPQIQASIEGVGPKNGQRRVLLNIQETKFGTFDGYKQSEQDVLQVATPEWMSGMTAPVVLMATMTVDVTALDEQSDRITPATNDPQGWENHSYSGVIASLHEDTAQVLEDVYLFDGISESESGVGLDTASYTGVESAVLEVCGGAILVDLSAFDSELSVGDAVAITASRTDLLGYRRQQL